MGRLITLLTGQTLDARSYTGKALNLLAISFACTVMDKCTWSSLLTLVVKVVELFCRFKNRCCIFISIATVLKLLMAVLKMLI